MHSIIIPHRDRNAYLEQCLWSIERSARECEVDDYEVVVVDNCSKIPVKLPVGHARVFGHGHPVNPFNKPLLQNIGISWSRGEILTFLDADAIVPKRWFDCGLSLLRLGSNAVTKLCYRVRSLPPEALGGLQDAGEARGELIDEWFDNYDVYPKAFEGYGEPHTNGDEGTPVFGNSQFSILRKCLGTLRFNEEYRGRGYEDLWLNRELWRRDKENYRAEIVTAEDYALLHLTQPGGGSGEWGAGKYNDANYKRYFAT